MTFVRPTRRLLLVLAGGAALALLPVLFDARLYGLWTVFMGVLGAVVVVEAVRLPRLGRARVEVRGPETAGVGDPLPLVLGATVPAGVFGAPGRLEAALELGPILAPCALGAGPVVDGRAELPFETHAVRRGEARVGAVWLRVPSPLGLVSAERRVEVDERVPVMPSIARVRSAVAPFFPNDDLRSGPRALRRRGEGTEFEALREFTEGFDHRSIDWKSSARHGQLLVRETRAERNQQIVVAVDTGRLMAEPVEGLPRVDHAIHAGLSLALLATRAGDRVGWFAFDEAPRTWLAPRHGMPAFRAIQREAAGLEYGHVESNFTLGITTLLSKLDRRSLVVVLTDFADAVTAELLVDNLGRASRRHLVLFVALQNPRFRAIATGAPADWRDANHALVADEHLRDRGVVLGRLRRLGIDCLDLPPSGAIPELLRRYLTIKQRERIA